jgi:hypothetical protein
MSNIKKWWNCRQRRNNLNHDCILTEEEKVFHIITFVLDLGFHHLRLLLLLLLFIVFGRVLFKGLGEVVGD